MSPGNSAAPTCPQGAEVLEEILILSIGGLLLGFLYLLLLGDLRLFSLSDGAVASEADLTV